MIDASTRTSASAGRENFWPEPEPEPSTWREVDLTDALIGTLKPVVPDLFLRDDGAGLLYAGRVHWIFGDSGEGKSMAVVVAAVQELSHDRHVVWIDLEDNEAVIVERLRQLGASDDAISGLFHYYRPNEPFDDAIVAELGAVCAGLDVSLLVIDSLGEAFGLEGIDEDRDVQVGPWLRRIARQLADAGPAVVIIDHSTKSRDNPLFPSGSKRKRAAITGAGYLVTARVPLNRDQGGKLTLTCAKDRHGNYRRGENVATVDLARYPDGGWSVRVWPPFAADKPDANLHALARAAVRAAKELGVPASKRTLLAAMNVRGSTDDKTGGIELAVTLGALRTENGPRNSLLHHYVKDLDA